LEDSTWSGKRCCMVNAGLIGMALHEAAQIAEFIRLGVDFTNPTARQPYYREAHGQALLTELDYWLDWAVATGIRPQSGLFRDALA